MTASTEQVAERRPAQRRSGLRVAGIVKTFGDLRANDDVDVEFKPGEVHGLLGENGAGKSTLVKILAGIYQADAGLIEIDGETITLDSPTAARTQGIAVVHQQSTLVPPLTVVENLALVEGGLGRIDPSLGDRLSETATKLGFEIDANARVDSLSVGQRQRVEIARALTHEARYVILDEPTPILVPTECEELFRVLRRVADGGAGVILVTHRLEEVRGECDQVTVLRNGQVVGNSNKPRKLTEDELIAMIVGERHVDRSARPKKRETGEVILEAKGLGGSPLGGHSLRELDIEVLAGEVLGVAGVEGNGQRELAAALVGSWRPDVGSLELRGEPLADYPVAELTRVIGEIPDDESLALLLHLSVWENLALGEFSWEHAPTPKERGQARKRAAELVEEFEIATRTIETPVGRLSGGNRRRVLLARELSKEPEVLVASYPIKGLDVRASERVREWINKATGRGAAVIYFASELEELIKISDRIAVIARGRITGVVPATAKSLEEIGRLMLAEVPQKEAAA